MTRWRTSTGTATRWNGGTGSGYIRTLRTATGDGIDDAEALRRSEEDPTVFSTTPPTVERLHYDQGVGVENYVPRYQFTYRYEISDPSGVKHYALRRGGIERDSETAPISLGENVTEETRFTDELERLSSTLRGAQTTVLVRDRHGNEREVTLVSQSDLATKLAGDHAPRTAGTVAGVSHGVAEIPDFANQLLRNHEALLEAVEAFAQEASPELLVAMIANMPADVHRMQHEVNPSDSPPSAADGPKEAASICIEQGLDVGASESKYCRYATGFYLGYGAFTAVELASGAKALVKGVRKAGDLADKIRGATDDIGSIRGALKAGKASLAETISRQVVAGDGGSPNVDGPSVREALDDLGADSSASKKRAIDALLSVDAGAADLAKLSSREQARLASRLYRTGDTDDAIAFAKQIEDAEDLRYLAEEDVGTLEQLAKWHQNPGRFGYVDSDIPASQYIHISRNSNLAEVRLIVDGADQYQTRGTVQWLETGDSSAGWEHIRQRHVTEDQFYRIDGIDSVTDVEEAIKSTIKRGTAKRIPDDEGGGTAYVYQYSSSKEISVFVGDNGYVVSARPGGYP